MSDITMDCEKCKEFQRMKGRAVALKELRELLPNCDYVEFEHLITLIEEVEKKCLVL